MRTLIEPSSYRIVCGQNADTHKNNNKISCLFRSTINDSAIDPSASERPIHFGGHSRHGAYKRFCVIKTFKSAAGKL